MTTWQLQSAKARLSELVKHAGEDGPQHITVHGQPVAVVISRDLFDRLSGNQTSLVDFIRHSPLCDQNDIVLERDRSPPREVDF